jgi:hypothetical protein
LRPVGDGYDGQADRPEARRLIPEDRPEIEWITAELARARQARAPDALRERIAELRETHRRRRSLPLHLPARRPLRPALALLAAAAIALLVTLAPARGPSLTVRRGRRGPAAGSRLDRLRREPGGRRCPQLPWAERGQAARRARPTRLGVDRAEDRSHRRPVA